MRSEVTMPHMGMSMEEGRVLTWFKTVGASLQRGDQLAEIETDKSTVVVEAPMAGTLSEIRVSAGTVAPVGAVLALIDDGAPETAPAPMVAEAHAEAATPPVATAAVEQPHRAPSPGVRARVTPLARRLAHERGLDLTQVPARQSDGIIDKAELDAYLQSLEAQKEGASALRVNASPLARRLAEEHGVDLARVRGSGPGGRIGKEDVEAYLAAQQQAAAPAPVPPVPTGVQRVPLSRIKQTVARRMAESKSTAPHFYVATEINMGRALELRESLKGRGIDISVNDLILRATALTLVKFPNLNASYADGQVLRFPQLHLAVAVALDDGLITPVIHDCAKLSLAELAQTAKRLAQDARAGHLRPEDLADGTFTVTNLGMFGVSEFKAIINPPQAAILAVGTVRRVPVFDAHDQVVPAHLLSACVSADHRVTDGAEVARFLQELKRILEDAFALL